MSLVKYSNNRQVWPHEGGRVFDVVPDDGRCVVVVDTDILGWAVMDRLDGEFVTLPGFGLATRFATADAAIDAVLGVGAVAA